MEFVIVKKNIQQNIDLSVFGLVCLDDI